MKLAPVKYVKSLNQLWEVSTVSFLKVKGCQMSNFMDLFASEDGSRNNKCMTKNCSSWPSIELNASFQKFNDDDDDDTDCTSSSDDSGDTFYESDSSISTFKY